MGRSNMLLNSVLLPRKFGRTQSTMHQYSNRLFWGVIIVVMVVVMLVMDMMLVMLQQISLLCF